MKKKKIELDEKLIAKILENDAIDAGIFISLLSYYYMKMCDLSSQVFLKSLKKSIKIIGKEVEKIGDDEDGSLGKESD